MHAALLQEPRGLSTTGITRVTPMPGGMFVVSLVSTQQLKVSRTQSRFLRKHVLRL